MFSRNIRPATVGVTMRMQGIKMRQGPKSRDFSAFSDTEFSFIIDKKYLCTVHAIKIGKEPFKFFALESNFYTYCIVYNKVLYIEHSPRLLRISRAYMKIIEFRANYNWHFSNITRFYFLGAKGYEAFAFLNIFFHRFINNKKKL